MLDLNFVEMWELVTNINLASLPGSPAHPIVTLSQWLKFYAIMAAILSTKFPDNALEFFAYQATIVETERNYEGSHWVTYDQQF